MRHSGSMSNGVAKFLLFQAIGETTALALAIPISGSFIAMLLLFFYLLGRENDGAKIAAFARQCLGHLALFVVPAPTSLVLHGQ